MILKKFSHFMKNHQGKKLVARALDYATKAHEGQIRKYVGEPYIEHPKRVAQIMKAHGFDHHVQAAALLHDTVEDCGKTHDEIHNLFGPKVGHLVYNLTDVTHDHGNRKQRKAIDDARLHRSDHETQSIKCADSIDNSPSIRQHDPSFFKTYKREKEHLLGGFKRAHPELLRQAKESIE